VKNETRCVISIYFVHIISFPHIQCVFSSPGQRPCVLLPSLGVRRRTS